VKAEGRRQSGEGECMPKQEIKAAVVRQNGGPFTIETLHLPDPREDEVLVRIEAAGICQTDAHARDQAYPVPLATCPRS
jgi:Zn-dependent alcohol dehydrogenase